MTSADLVALWISCQLAILTTVLFERALTLTPQLMTSTRSAAQK